jgi:predicted glycoside hydrolase/deacetylase ChbG (UPF0249 family)
MKALILCADDFAAHEAASQGIAQLAAMGRISATSAMVLSPRWATEAAMLKPLRERIDVGLHLDWTSEFAIAAGHGLSLGAAMIRAVLGGFDSVAARAQIEQQLDAFEAHWGAPPDHVDGHQHVQQFAGIREALVEALAARYPADPPYLRISRVPPAQADLKSRIITVMGAGALEKIAGDAGVPRAGMLSGIYDFTGDAARYACEMAAWLDSTPAGAIIMCHPALRAEPGDGIGAARAQEFAYLSGEDFPLALARAGVTLARGRTVKFAGEQIPD